MIGFQNENKFDFLFIEGDNIVFFFRFTTEND